MRIVFGLLLGVVYILSFFKSYRMTKDIFSPMSFFSAIQFIGYVPGIMLFDSHLGVDLDEQNTFIVFLMQVIVLIFTWLGTQAYRSATAKRTFRYSIETKVKRHLTFAGIVMYAIGFLSLLFFIYLHGGLAYIVTHTQISYGDGMSYLLSLQNLMVVGMLCFWGYRRRPNPLLLIPGFILYAAGMIIFTKRAPILEALLLLVMGYNYRTKRLRVRDFLSPKALTLILMFSVLVVTLPKMRTAAGFNVTTKDLLLGGMRQVSAVFEEFSYVSRDAFVYTHYGIDNMYCGRTIVNLITAPLPSRLFRWKPPVDDGVYLANYVYGHYVLPPTNVYPIQNSYPFSSQGSMYANFLLPGVMMGALLTGFIYQCLYRFLKDTEYHVLSIFLYQMVIYKFGLSAKNMTQTIVPIVLAVLAFSALAGLRVRRCRIQEEKPRNT